MSKESPWAVVVVTDVMLRAHSLSTADELVFIDSTSSCDAMLSTVTTVLTASQAGALPLAILLHEGQSTEAYKSAFGLLQLHYPQCFNGRAVCHTSTYICALLIFCERHDICYSPLYAIAPPSVCLSIPIKMVSAHFYQCNFITSTYNNKT